jgi:hypothetical protein
LTHKAIGRSRKFSTNKAPVARKQNLSDDSESTFLYDEKMKNKEIEYLASRSGKQQKLTLPVQMKMINLKQMEL